MSQQSHNITGKRHGWSRERGYYELPDHQQADVTTKVGNYEIKPFHVALHEVRNASKSAPVKKSPESYGEMQARVENERLVNPKTLKEIQEETLAAGKAAQVAS